MGDHFPREADICHFLRLALNTDAKSNNASVRITSENSTEEVRTWKEKLATESEVDVRSS